MSKLNLVNREIIKQSVVFSVRTVFLGILFAFLIAGVVYSPTYYFDLTRGDQYEQKVLEEINVKNGKPHEVASGILSWEQQSLTPMYMRYEKDSIYNSLGIFKMNNSWTYFHRGALAPHNYLLKQGLANCGEYARIFVNLMNESGHEATLLRAPADDHVYALYEVRNNSVVVNPSSGKVVDGKKFADRKNFSKIVAVGSEGAEREVTSQYVDLHNVTLRVKSGDENQRYEASVASLTAIRQYPNKYNSGEEFVEKSFTGRFSSFNLSESLYRIKLEKKGLILSEYYSKTVSVEDSSEVVFDLENMSSEKGLPSLF